jgi:hypothetical protein
VERLKADPTGEGGTPLSEGGGPWQRQEVRNQRLARGHWVLPCDKSETQKCAEDCQYLNSGRVLIVSRPRPRELQDHQAKAEERQQLTNEVDGLEISDRCYSFIFWLLI